MVQYSILKQIKSGKLILWDGPSLRRQAADRVIKIRRTDNPKEKFFVYKEDRNVEQTQAVLARVQARLGGLLVPLLVLRQERGLSLFPGLPSQIVQFMRYASMQELVRKYNPDDVKKKEKEN